MGERTKFYTRMNSVSLLVVLSALAASAAGDEVARKPKLFFVSTSSTTTTLQTASLCYATSGTTIGTCTGRKRRSINIEGVSLADVKPSQLNQEVQSSQEDPRQGGQVPPLLDHHHFCLHIHLLHNHRQYIW